VNLALTVLNVTAPVFMLALVGIIWVNFALVFVGRLDRSTYLAPLIFGNTGNIGLPLAFFAFGNEGLSYAVVVFAVMAILSFTLGIWMVAGAGSFGKVLKEPMVAGTLLGALFLWQGWKTPQVITNALELTGQMAIPLMLITLGVAIARLKVTAMTKAVAMSAFKAAVCVAAAWAVAEWFALPPVASAVLIVQVATPVAVTSYMIAEKYEADSETVAGLVVVSTLMSVITLPLILSFVM